MPVTARTRYDTVAMSLHWLIAALLIFMLFFGEEIMETEDGGGAFGPSLHVSIGSAILLLSVLRLVWRMINPPPAYSASMAPWERLAATATHVLFYVLLIGIPLTGWLATPKFLRDEDALAGLTLFGAFPLPAAPSLGLPMKGIHEIGSNLGIVLLALHVLAALKHHFLNRDDVLRRMLPFGRAR
ncbi:MAG: cytochrome b [Hyphomicrobiales bacterium]|nr:cytochrome b [Hyphomicrobiales bacterium]